MTTNNSSACPAFGTWDSLSSEAARSIPVSGDASSAGEEQFTLSGNVNQSSLSVYSFSDPTYSCYLEDPYASKLPYPLEVWGSYFADTIKAVKNNVSNRKGGAIFLDFADMMIIIASLSSLITLTPNDLNALPEAKQRYQSFVNKSNGLNKQKGLLTSDPILFRWFVCTFLLQGQAPALGEDIAKAMYAALRCGIVHNMTVGQVLNKSGSDYETTLADRNFTTGSTAWYEVHSAKPKCYSFFLKELLQVVEKLITDLFDGNQSEQHFARFRLDAEPKLSGKTPIKLLKVRNCKQSQTVS